MNPSLEQKIAYFLSGIIVMFLVCVIVLDQYKNYHAQMHSIPTWGRITGYEYMPRTGWRSVIEYHVNNQEYKHYTAVISQRHLHDSILIYYDTTNIKKSFLLLRNPKDVETAFFKSDERLLGLKWQKNLKKFQNELDQKRKAHRNRHHFYDYFCQDD